MRTGKKYNILIFTSFFEPHPYGLAVFVNELSRHLSVKVNHITIITNKVYKNSLDNEYLSNNVEVKRIPSFYLVFNYPIIKFWKIGVWSSVKNIFSNDSYDLVITNMRFFTINIFGLVYAKLRKKKLMHIEHASDFIILSSPFKTKIAQLYDFAIGRILLRKADINVSVAPDIPQFIKKFDKRMSPVINNSLNLDFINAIKPDEELKDKYQGKIIVAFSGRLCRFKGVEDICRVISGLDKNIKDKIIFLVIGYGELFEKLKKDYGKEAEIVFLGESERQQALSYIKAADIYIHASKKGGAISFSLLEAMYCGCAVIATTNEGGKELISDGKEGLLYKSDAEMEEAIMKLIKQPDLRKTLGGAARKIILNNFSWEKATEKYWLIIDDLLRVNNASVK